MEPINRNPQNMQSQSSSGASSQRNVHGQWNGRPLNNNDVIVMIPTPRINSNCNDEQLTPDSHQMGPPSNWRPVVSNSAPNNISNGNEVQPAANSHQMGPSPNQQPTGMNRTPSNTFSGNEVQPAANSHRMGPSTNQQPADMNRTPSDTFSSNEMQYAAYSDRLGVMVPKRTNVNTNSGNEVQPAAHSHRMGTPHNHQSIVMNITNPGTTSTSNVVQQNASQANVTGTGSLHPTSSITSNNFQSAGSDSEGLTSRFHQNNLMVSSRPPFGAQAVTTPTPNFYGPHMDQNLNCATPYNNQISSSTSNLLQNPQVSPQGVFSSEQHRPMPQATINRFPGYLQSASNNTNGVGFVPTFSTCPPVVRPQLQQEKLLRADAMNQMEAPNVANAFQERFMNYLRDWHVCQKNNTSEHWKRFVTFYYAPEAKRLCCQAAFEESSPSNRRGLEERPLCGHCRKPYDKKREISSLELAMFFQTKFKEYKNEMLQLQDFCSWKLGNNTTVFLFKDAVEKLTDDKFIFYRKGRLAVQFKADMKIINWQFCMSAFDTVDLSHAIACSKLNKMLEQAGNSPSANGSQPTLRPQTRNHPISNSTYPSSGANSEDVNLPAAQFVNSTNVLDTSAYASGCGPVTGITSSSLNPNAMINPLHAAHHVNARSLPVPSDSTNNLLKRVASSENGPDMDDLQRVTRQRLNDAFSGLATEDGTQNLASIADQTPGLDVNGNMDSGANQEHWSGINVEKLDTELTSSEIGILNSLEF